MTDSPEPSEVPTEVRSGFWTSTRVVVAIVVAIIALVCASCSAGVLLVSARLVSYWQEADARADVIEAVYPEYRVLESTSTSYTLQHSRYEDLIVIVPIFPVGDSPYWRSVPTEEIAPDRVSTETFFRHGRGMPSDQRTGMNYDVSGFARAYGKVDPGDRLGVSAVWLDGVDEYGVETYIVLLADRGAPISSASTARVVGAAKFIRLPDTGEWKGQAFRWVEGPEEFERLPTASTDLCPLPSEARDVASEFIDLLLAGDAEAAYTMRDAETWVGGDPEELAQLAASAPQGTIERQDVLGSGYLWSTDLNSYDEHSIDIFFKVHRTEGVVYYRVRVTLSPDGTSHPSDVEWSDELFDAWIDAWFDE